MAKITELTDEELNKKIKSAKVAVERNTGMILEASKKKLKKLEDELERRAKDVKKEVEKTAEKVEEKVEKAAEKVEEKVEDKPKKKTDTKKSTAKKATKKKPSSKKQSSSSTSEKFELVIDGKVHKFSDLASKEACEKAIEAVKARHKEVKSHKKARAEGKRKAASIPVTRRITDSFASITKKAVSEVSTTKINKQPDQIKKEVDALEKAFDNLFDKLGDLMGKSIPKNQRKQIMEILTKFEGKVEKGSSKKEKATTKVRKKEDGGFAGEGVANTPETPKSNPVNEWSYSKFL